MKPRAIQAIGGFFPKDKAGYILNPTHLNHIPRHWLPVLEKIKEIYKRQIGTKLHSIWLRGSLPRGLQVDHFSDLDTFALIYTSKFIKWKTASWAQEETTAIQVQFPFVPAIEFMLNYYREDLAAINAPLAMLIKTQSLCLYGEDIQHLLPRYRPSKRMALNYKWLEQDINLFLNQETFSDQATQQMMKQILRTSFELVLERAQEYTTDLYWNYKVFSTYYPNKAAEMQKALHFYLNPKQDPRALRLLVQQLGYWLIEKVKVQFY